MKEFKQMVVKLNDLRKRDPKEFYGSIAAVIIIFGVFYVTMWLTAILEGRM
jgi:hypothetical protein